ncbi:MAG: hypothetical protein JW774_04570 [Candidatus Aureabacteria bacterium]|nr:hypothetical protein [Candidatus Auribacterota bacterium]
MAGIHHAIAIRIKTLTGTKIEKPLVFTGGVSLNTGMVKAIKKQIVCSLTIPKNPEYTCAPGAALLASAAKNDNLYFSDASNYHISKNKKFKWA